LSAVFVQKIFLYDKYLASYTPDALRKVSKLSDFKQNWSGPNILIKTSQYKLEFKKNSFSSSYILAARRRGLFRSYNGIAKVSGVTSQNAWKVRHGESNRRIFKLFTAIVQTQYKQNILAEEAKHREMHILFHLLHALQL